MVWYIPGGSLTLSQSDNKPGEGNGNLLKYSCLGNFMNRRAWWVTVHAVATSQTQLSESIRSPRVFFDICYGNLHCCKEKYCIGTWNVRSMNQGKLEVVKQEMARVNIDILGISELKWTGIGEFNSDDHYIYYCGQESLRRNGVAIMVNKRV